jgi:CheY-like chemotaxis protein
MKQLQPDLLPSFQLATTDKSKFNCVLLIDDDNITNFITTSILKKLGICNTIKAFKNGREAFNFILNTDIHSEIFPDLILLDLHMPVMDGYEFLEIFNALDVHSKVRTVILSTSARIQDKERLKLSGIDFFIEKPLTEEKLIQLLNKLKEV